MGFWGSLAKIGGIAGAPFTGGASLAATAIGAGADIAGGIMAGKAAKTVAKKQLEASNTAIGTINQYGQNSRDALTQARDYQRADASGVLDRQRGYAGDALNSQLGALDPYAAQGPAALAALQGNAYDEWQGGSFKAPDVTQDPGYQFRMAEGQKALERSAAARGTTGGGAFAKALTRFGQDYGSQEYGKAYDRAAQEYDRTYGQFQDRSAQRWNRLSQLNDLGYNAVLQGNQARSAYGNNMAAYDQNYGNNLFNAEGNLANGTVDVNQWQAGNMSNIQLGAGNANAAGTVGAINAYGQAVKGVASRLGDYFGQRQKSAPVNYGSQPIGGTFQQQLRNRYNSYGR